MHHINCGITLKTCNNHQDMLWIAFQNLRKFKRLTCFPKPLASSQLVPSHLVVVNQNVQTRAPPNVGFLATCAAEITKILESNNHNIAIERIKTQSKDKITQEITLEASFIFTLALPTTRVVANQSNPRCGSASKLSTQGPLCVRSLSSLC